jgi:hypothetical protein
MPDEPTGTATTEAPETGAPEGGAQENGQATDHFDRILSRVEELGTNVEQLNQRLTPEETPAEPEDPVASLLAEMGYEVPDEDYQEPEGSEGPDREFLEMVMAATNKAVEKQLQEQLHPALSAIRERDLESAFADLEGRFPKLVEDEQWREKVLDTAESLAGGDRAKLEDPTFIELVHKSLLLDERAAQDTPVGDAGSGLERPSGANPAAASGESQQEIAQRIVRARGNDELRRAGLV